MLTTLLRVRLTPKAGRNEIVRIADGVLYVRVAAPPVEGEANKALLALLAETLGLRKTALSLKSGASSRDKIVEIEGIDAAEAWARLEKDLAANKRR